VKGDHFNIIKSISIKVNQVNIRHNSEETRVYPMIGRLSPKQQSGEVNRRIYSIGPECPSY
jgi:hypothetical protein